MTDRDKPEFLKTVTAMAMMYQRDCPMAVIDLYFQVLRNLEIEQVKAAVVSLLGTSKFMPRAAEIREAIEGPALVLKTSPAERAWTKILEMVSTLHDCNQVECDDPALAKALEVAIGPWDYAVHRLMFDAGLDEIGRTVLRKNFCAAYESAVSEGVPMSGACVVRWPRWRLRYGHQFALGLSDKNGVRVHKFASEALALAWRDQKALQAAPTPAALVAHEEK